MPDVRCQMPDTSRQMPVTSNQLYEQNKIGYIMKKFYSFTIFLLLFLLTTSAFAKAESFSLRDTDGELVRLDDYLGKGPVVLDFWATWCKPCVKSLPKMQKLYEKLQDRGLVVLAINEDGPRSLAKVAPFASSLGLTFPILLDEDRDVVRQYQVSGLPTTIIIDKDQNVVHTMRGYRPGDEKAVEQLLESLLGEE
ncbi:hypothetical protein A2V82_07375 [candidate division KSB1 bacterium RBG_16_48_16]|nr:MAG: hypothetical protein A2V82_07375 [candidate division KSB1 bacterium RBG_16_48_16]